MGLSQILVLSSLTSESTQICPVFQQSNGFASTLGCTDPSVNSSVLRAKGTSWLCFSGSELQPFASLSPAEAGGLSATDLGIPSAASQPKAAIVRVKPQWDSAVLQPGSAFLLLPPRGSFFGGDFPALFAHGKVSAHNRLPNTLCSACGPGNLGPLCATHDCKTPNLKCKMQDAECEAKSARSQVQSHKCKMQPSQVQQPQCKMPNVKSNFQVPAGQQTYAWLWGCSTEPLCGGERGYLLG